jgi:hypothetical protein
MRAPLAEPTEHEACTWLRRDLRCRIPDIGSVAIEASVTSRRDAGSWITGKVMFCRPGVPILASPDQLFSAPSATLQRYPELGPLSTCQSLFNSSGTPKGNLIHACTLSSWSQNPGAPVLKRFKFGMLFHRAHVLKSQEERSLFCCDFSSNSQKKTTFALQYGGAFQKFCAMPS